MSLLDFIDIVILRWSLFCSTKEARNWESLYKNTEFYPNTIDAFLHGKKKKKKKYWS